MKYFYFTFIIVLISSLLMQAQVIETLVDVGGYELHFEILKGNETAILFENGGGDELTVWDEIIETIHQNTGATIITYDRSGFGKSKAFENDRNIMEEIIGLENGLTKLGIKGKILIVSHSYGGLYASLFASRNPKQMLGYVAIDADLPSRFSEDYLKNIDDYSSPIMDSLLVANPGLHNIFLSINEDIGIVSDSPIPVNMPVLDIVAEKQPEDSLFVMDCHRQFVSESENRELIISKNSGHYIFRHDPDLVINAIVTMYNKRK